MLITLELELELEFKSVSPLMLTSSPSEFMFSATAAATFWFTASFSVRLLDSAVVAVVPGGCSLGGLEGSLLLP